MPPEYIGHQVWVRWDSRCVRVFNDSMEQVQMHTRIEPGKFSRVLGAGGFSAPILASCRHWRERAALLGDHCEQWAGKAIELRGPQAMRSIMGPVSYTHLDVYKRQAYHIERPDDLRPEWFRNIEHVGLTGGTSTLPETVAQVRLRMLELTCQYEEVR